MNIWTLGQGKKTEDANFTMNCASRLSIKISNASIIGKLKTKILLPVWTFHKSVFYKQSNPGQTFKLKFMFKKKTRKLSQIFCTLKSQQLKEFFVLFCFLESGIRKEGT